MVWGGGRRSLHRALRGPPRQGQGAVNGRECHLRRIEEEPAFHLRFPVPVRALRQHPRGSRALSRSATQGRVTPGAVRRIARISLTVADLDRSEAFYRECFGF